MAVVTISRQYGSGGILIARRFAEKHNYRFIGREEFVEGCQARGVQMDLERIEGRVPSIFERVFGVDRENLRKSLSEIMEEEANKGNVVIGGWGGQVLLKDRADALHLRIVGSVESRIRHFMDTAGVTRSAAEETIRRTDRDQTLFSEYFFNVNFADPLLYHALLSIEQMSPDVMVGRIAALVSEIEAAA